MGIKLIRKNNEALGSVIRNANRYDDCFMIDCGSPENAIALADAIEKEAYGHPLGSAEDDAGKHFLGGEIVQFWPVGQYFTACVNPCDKAAAWCEEWLRNSGGAAPGIQGNSAGLESNNETATNEDDVGVRLTNILNGNDVWSEVSGGDNDALVDEILDGEWIGLMCGPNSDDAADWDAYIKDTFGPFSQYVAAEWFSPDKNDPDFKTVRIKFKPRFALGDKETQTSVLNRLGDKIADGYIVMMEKRNEALSPKMQQRRKWKSWQEASLQMKGFEEAGYSFLDLCRKGDYTFIETAVPTKCYDSKEEALAGAKKNFDDFDEYLDISALYDPEGGPDGEAVWFPSYKLKDSFADLPEGEGLEVLSELSDTLYRMYTKGESASEDRRGTDRYGHPVKRFTTKDLKGLDGEVIGGNDGNGDDAGTPSNFGLAYLDTTSIDAFSNNFIPSVRDRFLHDLAQMPVSKKSIEDLLRKHKLHKFGAPIGVRDFFPENGIAYLGTYGDDGLPRKTLCLRWGPALKK